MSISGLAAAIRGSTESDTFDLAGQNVNTITTNMKAAFQDPLPVSEMIRITFVTGAGKLGRQKYDADAAKAVTSTLRELGFEEDRGASCVKECAGSFKLQHDTGKNLKTVVVFPRISEASSNENAGDNSDGNPAGASIFEKGSAEEMIAMSSKSVFQNILKSRCPAWSQKKGCLAAIIEIKKILGEIEQNLMNGTPLSDAEQAVYDSVSSSDLDEKQTFVKDQMHQQVDSGNITSREKAQLLSQVNGRLETLETEIAEAENDKPKRAEKLKAMKEKATERKEKITNIVAKAPHALKHVAQITKLRTELEPLLDFEADSKGRLLSVKETQNLARKEEILEEIAELEASSRGWFEDDEAFEARLEASNKKWTNSGKQKKKSGAKKPSSGGSSGGWKTSMPSSTSWGKPRVAAKKKPAKKGGGGGGGVFAAMMMDSDSD